MIRLTAAQEQSLEPLVARARELKARDPNSRAYRVVFQQLVDATFGFHVQNMHVAQLAAIAEASNGSTGEEAILTMGACEPHDEQKGREHADAV
ncbi:hypothetical protein EBZ80_14890 [bacterium]|nr:hypothetical protein [bacterium]